MSEAAPIDPDPARQDTSPLPLLLVAGSVPEDLAASLPGFELLPVALDTAPDDPNLRAAMAPARLLLAPRASLTQARDLADAAGLPDLAVAALEDAITAVPAALAARLAAAERDAGIARRSAALLRRETEEVSRRLNTLEAFIWGLGGPRQMQALHWPPADRIAHAPAADAVLTQRLPIDSPGIAAVDLWLPDAGESEARELSVAILDSEGTVHALRLDDGALRRDDGWLRFLAPAPLAGDRQDCSLQLSGADPKLSLGLGPAVPDPDFALHGSDTQDGEDSDRTLALRVWRATGGAGLTITEGGAGRPGNAFAQRIRPADMPRPSLLATPRGAKDYVATAFWAGEDAILVHPSAGGPVCALLQRVPLAGLTRLSAVVHAARRDGPPVAFALGVSQSGNITEDNWADHLGPWVTLPPGGWGEVHAPLKAAAMSGERCDVALATAVAGGASNDNAWALFRAFRAVGRFEP
ncbi:hypothetical protein DRW48_07705 [Paracoccus suum]|uniref:Uncharacterized protein n=1 Tax=Paracoccus suum TaxID=2259340 RepID=A0A344PJN6_9RHOB|nr:DUF6212 domain-containing protein [Paracoccus suum]AXC49591.1 hypothetical protein DRW48_07705 [Paracoccus suum]